MNRSLTNVLFGGIAAPAQSDYKIEGQITQTSVDETVDALENAESVIIVRSANRPPKYCCSSNISTGRRLWHGSRKGAIRYLRNC